MRTGKMSKALDEVALLIAAINLNMSRYADGDNKETLTAIDILRNVIHDHADGLESRESANEAREALRELQDAVDRLRADLCDT